MSDEKTHFLLLAGHGSRTELEFMQRMSSPKLPWTACIGVPYGTSLLQVGDSSEQNGSFNMGLTKAKSDLVAFEESMQINSKRVSTNATTLVRTAWEASFAKIETNKKAMCDRGWNPCNRVLLQHPEIRATMASEEKFEELSMDVYCKSKEDELSSLTDNLPEIDQNFLKNPSDNSVALNFQTGFATNCL